MQTANRINLAVFLISGTLLAYEVLAIRLISVLFFAVASYLIISLALLGLGIGGVMLALRRIERPLTPQLAGYGALLFGFSLLITLMMIRYIQGLSSPVLLIILALAVPFAFGGWTIAVSLALPGVSVNRIYFADLLGAGAGALLVFFGLMVLSAERILILLAAAAFLSMALFAIGSKARLIGYISALLSILVVILIKIPYGLTPISPKELAQVTRLGPNYEWEYQGWNPIARIDVVHIPGGCTELLGAPGCKLVTQDGGAPSILFEPASGEAASAFINQTIFGLPYWIKDDPDVLIIGLGGAPDVQAALIAGARSITGVEINRQMVSIVENTYAVFTGYPYQNQEFTLVVGDGRNYVRRADRRFDVIQLTGVDSSVASLGASPNLTENYLYTVEAFDEFYQHLTEDGVLSVSFPAVEGLDLKLIATAYEAMRLNGVARPQDHLVVSRITGYFHVLIKHSSFSRTEIDTIQAQFNNQVTSFYFPFYHRLFGEPSAEFIAESHLLFIPFMNTSHNYSDFLKALEKGQPELYLASKAQQVLPATDNRPFFFVMDKWGKNAPNLSALVVTLSILGLTAFVLMVLPLLVQNLRGLRLPGAPFLAIYFICLGVGYILIEVNQIQKLTLLLGHPSLAIVFTLFILLIASGLGSIASERWNLPPEQKVFFTTVAVAVLIGGEAYVTGTTTTSLTSLNLVSRLVMSLLLVGLPGFLMGVPFPTGLGVVKRRAAAFVAWAWVINGVGSIMATLLGVLFAILWGFQAVFLLAGGLYISAGFVFLLFCVTSRKLTE